MDFQLIPQVWTLCHCQTLWKLTLSGAKCSSETTNQDGHCHGYALFPFSAWTWITPSFKLEPQYLFNASTHSRQAWKHGTRHKGTFQLCQSLVNVLYLMLRISVISLPAGSISEWIISELLGAIFLFKFSKSLVSDSLIFTYFLSDNLMIEIIYFIINYFIKSLNLVGRVLLSSLTKPKVLESFS